MLSSSLHRLVRFQHSLSEKQKLIVTVFTVFYASVCCDIEFNSVVDVICLVDLYVQALTYMLYSLM